MLAPHPASSAAALRATPALEKPQVVRQASSADPTRLHSERLGSLVRSAAQLDLHLKPGPQMTKLIREAFPVEAVAIFDADLNEMYADGEWFADPEQMVRNICVFATVRDDPDTGLMARVLRAGNMPVGALLLRGEMPESTATSIAALIAITFDRYHSMASEMRMESAKNAEQLRTTVLDSLAHAYKTPLTAIRAASTGLAEMGGLSPAQNDLLALIEEQAEALNQLTTRLLKTARLEAQALSIDIVAVAPLIDDVLAGARDPLSAVRVKVAMEREDLTLSADRGLLEALLTQFVENAGKYADAGSTVTISAYEQSSSVVFSVHNQGPAIPAADRERIFDRYFRSTGAAPGTGIGLSVAKQAALAHGGDVWVTSDAVRGTTFFASLPAAPAGGTL